MRTTIGTLAAPAVADLRGVVHQLVEAGGDEVVELHLADRPLPGQRRADADAEHRAFGERRVEDAIAELLRAAAAAAGTRCRSCRRRPRRRRTRAGRRAARRRRRASPLRGTCCPSCRTAAPVSSGGSVGVDVDCASRRAGSSTSMRDARRFVREHADAGLVRLRPRRVDHRAAPAPRRASRPRASTRRDRLRR